MSRKDPVTKFCPLTLLKMPKPLLTFLPFSSCPFLASQLLIFKKFIYLFIVYLVVLGLSCGTWKFWLWPVRFSSLARD